MRLYPVNYLSILVATGIVVLPALGDYRIAWWNTSGGGARSSGGVYRLTGTLGQATGGSPVRGGPFSLTSGFQVILLQDEAAPELRIVSSRGQIVLAWPGPSGSFQLEEATDLTHPEWKAVAQTPRLIGQDHLVTVPAEPRDHFFRLHRK